MGIKEICSDLSRKLLEGFDLLKKPVTGDNIWSSNTT
jgi:hypothetical protein